MDQSSSFKSSSRRETIDDGCRRTATPSQLATDRIGFKGYLSLKEKNKNCRSMWVSYYFVLSKTELVYFKSSARLLGSACCGTIYLSDCLELKATMVKQESDVAPICEFSFKCVTGETWQMRTTSLAAFRDWCSKISGAILRPIETRYVVSHPNLTASLMDTRASSRVNSGLNLQQAFFSLPWQQQTNKRPEANTRNGAGNKREAAIGWPIGRDSGPGIKEPLQTSTPQSVPNVSYRSTGPVWPRSRRLSESSSRSCSTVKSDERRRRQEAEGEMSGSSDHRRHDFDRSCKCAMRSARRPRSTDEEPIQVNTCRTSSKVADSDNECVPEMNSVGKVGGSQVQALKESLFGHDSSGLRDLRGIREQPGNKPKPFKFPPTPNLSGRGLPFAVVQELQQKTKIRSSRMAGMEEPRDEVSL